MDKRKCQKNLPAALSGCQFCRCPQPSKRSLGERKGGEGVLHQAAGPHGCSSKASACPSKCE